MAVQCVGHMTTDTKHACSCEIQIRCPEVKMVTQGQRQECWHFKRGTSHLNLTYTHAWSAYCTQNLHITV